MAGIMGMVIAPFIGAILAFLAMFGLVASQTSGPDTNPSDQTPIVYGE